MMRHLAVALCEAAGRLLPATRKRWADAMIVELSHADDDRDALAFGAGCLHAALRERARDLDTRFAAGLWSIAVFTALFAVLRLECAARGIAVLLGARDGMRDLLAVQGASLALLARYDFARPAVTGCFVILGCAHLAGGWFLGQGQVRRFMAAWCVALVVAAFAVAVQLSVFWQLDGVPSEFHALLVQAIAVPALLAWFHRRQSQLER